MLWKAQIAVTVSQDPLTHRCYWDKQLPWEAFPPDFVSLDRG